jgi:hypothetical protein
MKQPTLLETALQRPPTRGGRKSNIKITDQHIELAIAYLNGQVQITDISRALHSRGGAQVYTTIARAVRAAWQKGVIGETEARSQDQA